MELTRTQFAKVMAFIALAIMVVLIVKGFFYAFETLPVKVTHFASLFKR